MNKLDLSSRLAVDAHVAAPGEEHTHTPLASIRETIDSIVIAFILAFVFRAFLVEAFIIPTGSMAATLYGAHGTIVCEDCGFEFAYGLKDDPRSAYPPNVGPSHAAWCPNCNHRNTNLIISDSKANAEAGDRILVLKWPLDIGGPGLDAKRWDVIVFKDPGEGVMNYIKRLVGLPNEVLMLVDGDAYTVPVDELPADTLSALKALHHEKYLLQSGQKEGRLPETPEAVLSVLDKKLRIARKATVAKKSLWMPVYNHDYLPRIVGDGQPYWRPGLGGQSPWQTAQRRILFRGAGDDADNTAQGAAPTDSRGMRDYIEFAGKEIEAVSSYNIGQSPSQEPVSDLRLRFVLTPLTGDGTLGVRLEKRGRMFWAVLNMDGTVFLAESVHEPGKDAPRLATKKLPPFPANRSVEVSFDNLDYRLSLSVGGQVVLATSDDPTDAAYYGPDLHALRLGPRPDATQPPRIYGADGDFDVHHLALERDVHYFDCTIDTGRVRWAYRGWGTTGNPILLRDGEYFMLGDNSAASKDSRLWDQVGPHLVDRGEAYQLGTVARDQLIGRAFFVYWPSGHRIQWLPSPFNKRGFVPDVGRMRWIR